MRKKGAASQKLLTLGDLLYWSYANLALADVLQQRAISKPDTLCWMVRAKLFKGLRTGAMSVSSLFEDVREMPIDRCVYCGALPSPKLHADHLIPRHRGGPESGDNLVRACRSCNSSKGSKDVLEWYASKTDFPSVAIMRRYLKLAMLEAQAKELMDVPLAQQPLVTFSIGHIPTSYPWPARPVAIVWTDRSPTDAQPTSR